MKRGELVGLVVFIVIVVVVAFAIAETIAAHNTRCLLISSSTLTGYQFHDSFWTPAYTLGFANGYVVTIDQHCIKDDLFLGRQYDVFRMGKRTLQVRKTEGGD